MMRCFFNFVKSFTKVQWARLRGYEVLAASMDAENRWRYCRDCAFFDGAQCEVCCCMAEAKVMIAPEKCPKGVWPAIWIKKVDRSAN